MIVGKDHRGCVDAQSGADVFSGVDHGAVDGAAGQLFSGKNSMSVVKSHRYELFVHQPAKSHPEKVRHIAVVGDAAWSSSLA